MSEEIKTPDEDEQPKKITGYRDLTDKEIDLINLIKKYSNEIGSMVSSLNDISEDEENNIWIDERSMNIGITHLQDGFMWLVRSVAKPEGF